MKHKTYPFSLTNPDAIPQQDLADPHPLPPTASAGRIHDEALIQLKSIIANANFGNNTCARCQALLEVLKFVALAAPEQTPDLLIETCNLLQLSSTCNVTFGRANDGAVMTQVLSNADVGGFDGQVREPLFHALA